MDVRQIVVMSLCGLLMGIGKTGLPIVMLIGVVVMASNFDFQLSIALVLLLYIPGDFIGLVLYWRHSKWKIIAPFLPFFAAGVLLAALIAQRISPRAYGVGLGVILLLLTGYSLGQRYFSKKKDTSSKPCLTGYSGWSKCAAYGTVAGFSSMFGNVGGPFSFLYILPFNLSKKQVMATIVWIFALGNQIKLGFHIFYLNTINTSLPWRELFIFAWPAVLIGAAVGPVLLRLTNDKIFRLTLYLITIWGGLDLLYTNLF